MSSTHGGGYRDPTSPWRVPLWNRYGKIVAHTIVDRQDFARVARYRWHRDSHGYARANHVPGLLMHRLILGLSKGDGLCGDHINRNPLDNRRENLRVVTPAENAQNRCKHRHARHSQYRGVAWEARRGRWVGIVRINGKKYRTRRFESEADAAQAVVALRAKLLPFATD